MTEGAQASPWIELGVIARPHGVRGEVRVHVYNPESTLLEELAEVFLIGSEGAEPSLVEIESTRPGPKTLLLRLAGVTSKEDADALRGYTLCIPRAALPELDDGEYYHVDLVGLQAYDGDEPVGEVTEVIDYPSVECLRIQRSGGYIEVPMLERWLVRVDVPSGKVYLHDLSDIPLQRKK